MPIIKLPGGLQLHVPKDKADEVRRKVKARHKFSMDYCKRHAFDPDKLTVSQIMEIRSDQGWKDAGS